ncbi:MAG: AAA family ATPase [Bacilli bacterium]
MNIIEWHKIKYPLIQKQDIHKLIYQIAYGNAHMINDISKVNTFLLNEINFLDSFNQDLYDYVGDFARISLRTYLKYYFSINYLLNSFILSSNNIKKDDSLYEELLKEYNIDKDMNLSHSDTYKLNYKPNYRLIHKDYITSEMRYIQAYNFIVNQDCRCIISLEGKCGSGKSYLADRLSKHLDITVLHMDNFFLPNSRKTKDRLNEIGGNIDYKLVRDTLINIKNNNPKSIKIFDCKKQEYYKIPFNNKKIIILEGVYSSHPFFKDLIDKAMFIDTPLKLRLERLQLRDNYERYIQEWIPLEDKYYNELNIQYSSDLII